MLLNIRFGGINNKYNTHILEIKKLNNIFVNIRLDKNMIIHKFSLES